MSFMGTSGGNSLSEILRNGLPYAVTLSLILLFHEFGHYIAARRWGVDATLPYFIPFPSYLGTLGAVIRTRSPIPNRRALLYIGAMGPLPGFVVTLCAAIYGISVSRIMPLPAATGGEFPVFGNSFLFYAITRFFHGPIPPGHDIFLSPVAWAAWVGCLITGLNLMPVGQLDGGHVLYAIAGRKQRYAGWITLGVLAVMSFYWPGWIIWIVMSFLLLMIGHPPVPEGEELTSLEKGIGWFAILVFFLTIIPFPIELI